MSAKNLTGLYQRRGIWHIDKQYRGVRVRQSVHTSDRAQAEAVLIQILADIDRSRDFKQRKTRTFTEAATRWLHEVKDKPSAEQNAYMLKDLIPFIGHLPLDKIHDGTMAKFIAHRQKTVKNRTINIAIELVIRILNKAARKWRDENGMTWLDVPPALSKLDEKADARAPYPITWEQQRYLLAELPPFLARMVLFKVNSGCREQEVCQLQWDWEIPIPELGTSVFLVPAGFGGRSGKGGVKNRDIRLIVLNDVARRIIDKQRGLHKQYVFPYQGRRLKRMNITSWRQAHAAAAEKMAKEKGTETDQGFAKLRVHDLKHTYGHRLRIGGVQFEDRQVLLGHKNRSVTTHYSAPELGHLIKMSNKVLETENRQQTTLTILRKIA